MTSVTITAVATDTIGATATAIATATATAASGFPFPHSATTGVPAGATLTPSGSLTISKAGTYSGLSITGGVAISASNVTLQNCLINMVASGNEAIYVGPNLKNVIIQNCEVAGSGTAGQSGDYGILILDGTQVTINACNIHDVASGIVLEGGTVGSQVLIENCYIHSLNGGSGSHINGIGFFGQSGPSFSLSIQNNTVWNAQNQTDAIMLQNYFGSVNNVTVTGNLLIADNYTMYIDGHQNTYPVTNVTATNNAMTFGQYGYFYLVPGSASQFSYTVSGNYDAVSGVAAGPNGTVVSPAPNLVAQLTALG
jgi:serralysin